MKFGVREICDVVFKAKADTKIGTSTFKKGQPVLYIDSAKTSTVEGAATTVYAQGGRGNTRLIAWEGEKTLTFTVEDALLSPVGFAVLSGAGLFKQAGQEVHVHTSSNAYVSADGVIDLTDALKADEEIDKTAPIFVMVVEDDGSLTGDLLENLTVSEDGKTITGATTYAGKTVHVDFYIVKDSANVSELQIDAANFGGQYYVEASTLFRRRSDGVDMPAEITLPNVKIQSNFTFSMASTGDPSTFTFTMDAFPGYTIFDRTKQVLCVMQIIEDATSGTTVNKSVMPHETGFEMDETKVDSTDLIGEAGTTTDDSKKKSDKVEMFPQTTDLLGKIVSELITPDTYVAMDGSVVGTINYVTGYTGFNSTKPSEQEGYYFPIKMKATGTKMTIKKNGTARADKTDMNFDPELLLRIDDNNTTYSVEVDGAEALRLSFKNTKLVKN